MLAGGRLRGRLLRDLYSSEPWDLFFCGFSETHCAGHQLWGLEQFDAGAEFAEVRHAQRDIYAEIDAVVGSLVEAAGPQTTVIVFSGHGMAHQYHGRDLLPGLFDLWGLSGARRGEPDPSNERRIQIKRDLVQRVKEAVPIRWQYAVKALLPKSLEQAAISRVMGRGKLDPRALAFAVPNNELVATVRINLKGRDPHGRVEPGAEYEEMCDWITARFRELINPLTRKPAITTITRMRDLFHEGPQFDALPDFTARWSGEAPLDAVCSPGYGTVVGAHRDRRTGGHAAEGVMIVKAAAGARFDLDAAHGKDIAPTVLNLLGVPAPEEMEGRSLAERIDRGQAVTV